MPPIPDDYATRIATMQARSRALIAKAGAQGTKGATLTAKEEIEHRIKELVASGKAEHAGQALDLLMAERPALWAQYMREPPTVRKTAPDPAPVTVTHPQGVKKDRDGAPLSWDEQVKYWKEYPGTYERYRMHFATGQRPGRG